MGSNDVRYSDKGVMYLRKSMIESYNFCPYQFKSNWIDGISTEANYKMIIGTRFHEFAQWFFDVCGGVDPDNWQNLIPNTFTDFEQDMAGWFIDMEYKRLRDLDYDVGKFMPVAREIKLEDTELCLTGTCDRVDWISKDKNIMAVVEYKTGASFNHKSIVEQLGFYKVMWDNNIKLGNLQYMRYINPRLKEYKLIEAPTNINDIVYMNIAKIRGAIREEKYPRKCSEIKHIICNLCSAEDCGAYEF